MNPLSPFFQLRVLRKFFHTHFQSLRFLLYWPDRTHVKIPVLDLYWQHLDWTLNRHPGEAGVDPAGIAGLFLSMSWNLWQPSTRPFQFIPIFLFNVVVCKRYSYIKVCNLLGGANDWCWGLDKCRRLCQCVGSQTWSVEPLNPTQTK